MSAAPPSTLPQGGVRHRVRGKREGVWKDPRQDKTRTATDNVSGKGLEKRINLKEEAAKSQERQGLASAGALVRISVCPVCQRECLHFVLRF